MSATFTKENIGSAVYVSGEGFVLYKTDNILKYAGKNLKDIHLDKQEAVICDVNKIKLKNNDIFLIP